MVCGFPTPARFCAILIFLFSFSAKVFSQSADQVLQDTTSISDSQLQQLKSEYGKNKKIPPVYERLIFYTLSFFPELKVHKIKFKIRDHGAPIAARPAWGDLFRSAKKRTYMVLIRAKTGDSFSFNSAPIPGQVGILGHELCHVLKFSQKTSFDLIGIGISHASKKYMDRFEFYTDSACIEQGLGYYLLSWAEWIEKTFGPVMGDFNNAGKNTPTGERYMGTATIRKYIEKSTVYRQKPGSQN